MEKKNHEVRQAIEAAGLKYYEVGFKLNLNDGNFSRKLRKELPLEEKEKIFKIIEELKNEMKGGIN
jgi:hypothetical protein